MTFIYLAEHRTFLPPEDKKALEEMAKEILQSNLSMSLGKSKAKNNEAWKMQKEFRKEFVNYFGDDVIILPGHKLTEKMDRFFHFHNEKAMNKMPEEKKEKFQGISPKIRYPEDLTSRDTVGVIFDETEGLWSDSISTLPFRKMVEKHPENSRKVFAVIFNKQNWDNVKDFNKLMKKYKFFLRKNPYQPRYRLIML